MCMKLKQKLGMMILALIAVIFIIPAKPSQAIGTGVAMYMDKSTATIAPKEKLKLGAILGGTEANQAFTWKSSNPKIASVNKKGEVTGKKKGKCKIIATYKYSYGKKPSIKCTVTVKKKNLTLEKTNATINTGSTLVLKPAKGSIQGPLKWKSSNTGVAVVSKSGTVTAKKAGTATITASFYGKKTKCQITVADKPVKISLPSSSIIKTKGASFKLTPKVSGSNEKPKFSSSNTSILKVDSDGNVTTTGAGDATVTISVAGAKVTCDVHVYDTTVEFSNYLGKKVSYVADKKEFAFGGNAEKNRYNSYVNDAGIKTNGKRNVKWNSVFYTKCSYNSWNRFYGFDSDIINGFAFKEDNLGNSQKALLYGCSCSDSYTAIGSKLISQGWKQVTLDQLSENGVDLSTINYNSIFSLKSRTVLFYVNGTHALAIVTPKTGYKQEILVAENKWFGEFIYCYYEGVSS